MYVHGVVGAPGVGITATAVNLAATLRREGHHAALLDLTGDAVGLFGLSVDATVADALTGDASVGDATTRVAYADEVTDELRNYYAALGPEQAAFGSGTGAADPSEPEPGALPVVIGGDRRAVDGAGSDAVEAVRADLAFAYDHLIVDARTLDPAVATVVDDVIAVSDVQEEALDTAKQGIAACVEADVTVMGAVVNRAGHRADLSWLSDRLEAEILAIVPADERTPAVEPVAHTAPDSPAAAAYDRLTARIVEWDGGPDSGGGSESAAAGDGDDEGGLLGRLVDSWARSAEDAGPSRFR